MTQSRVLSRAASKARDPDTRLLAWQSEALGQEITRRVQKARDPDTRLLAWQSEALGQELTRSREESHGPPLGVGRVVLAGHPPPGADPTSMSGMRGTQVRSASCR